VDNQTEFKPSASVEQHVRYWVTRAREQGRAGVRHKYHSEKAAAAESEQLKSLFITALQKLKDEGRLGESDRALDFGCGWGRWTYMLADFVGSAIGLDISPSYIDMAKSEKHVNFELIRDPTAPLVIPDKSIKLIFTCTVLQHLVRKELFNHIVSEFRRVLTADGVLFFFECMASRIPNKPHIVFRSLDEYQGAFNWVKFEEQSTMMIRGERHRLVVGCSR